jgi:iron(III) transport system ATP-binding protein
MSIKLNRLRKQFGQLTAVNDLSLEVPEGKMLVLLGPSGCGKTTTMRCIAGLEKPNGGSIMIGSSTVYDEAKKIDVPVNQRNCGMVFQSYAIWPHMTVFDNVGFPLRVKNTPRAEMEERVHTVLAQVGLTEFADRGASYLSGGQMQRVALARSLVMRPSVLLFDEPLSNLDARLRDRLRIQLRELQTQFNITSVYVTHDQHEALALADQIAVMHKGDVLQLADPVSIYSQPNSSTVADFLGYSNIFKVAEVRPVDGGVEARLEDSKIRLMAAQKPHATGDLFLCMRPEEVAIAKAGTVSRDDGLAGEVILASFMGSFMQYRVRTDGGETIEVVSSDIAAGVKLGDRVALSVPPRCVHLLPKL